jgi:pimeloyl-ACP methyl ester carboxylesterase
MTPAEVTALRDAPGGQDVVPIAAATLPREARALAVADLADAARRVSQPAGLLLGTASPSWAGQITRELAAALPAATVIPLPGAGHVALEQAPEIVAAELLRFLNDVLTLKLHAAMASRVPSRMNGPRGSWLVLVARCSSSRTTP